MTVTPEIGWGIRLQRQNDDDPSTWDDIAGLTDINGPAGQRNAVDVTQYDSPNATAEKIAGILDWGTVTLTINFDHTSDSQQQLVADFKAGTVKGWRIALDPEDDTVVVGFSAFVTKFDGKFPVGGARTSDLELTVTGDVTFPS